MPPKINLEPNSVLSTAEAPDLIDVFNRLFREQENTILVGGGAEPEYIPACDNAPARVIFREDYAASALHEIAHWCIAGPERRKQHDFGYWYEPDGRTAEKQKVFESVEIKPQALEWCFAMAAGRKFNLSADNLGSSVGPSEAFRQAVFEQCKRYLAGELQGRAKQFFDALTARFNTTPQAPEYAC